MPVARQRPRAPAMLRPWVVVRERYAGMIFPRKSSGACARVCSSLDPFQTRINGNAYRTVRYCCGLHRIGWGRRYAVSNHEERWMDQSALAYRRVAVGEMTEDAVTVGIECDPEGRYKAAVWWEAKGDVDADEAEYDDVGEALAAAEAAKTLHGF